MTTIAGQKAATNNEVVLMKFEYKVTGERTHAKIQLLQRQPTAHYIMRPTNDIVGNSH